MAKKMARLYDGGAGAVRAGLPVAGWGVCDLRASPHHDTQRAVPPVGAVGADPGRARVYGAEKAGAGADGVCDGGAKPAYGGLKLGFAR